LLRARGARGASRVSSARFGRAPPQRHKERQQEESSGQKDRDKVTQRRNKRQRTAPSTNAQTQEQNEDAQQEDSATRKKIEARTKYAKQFMKVPVSLRCVRKKNDCVPLLVLVVGFVSLSFL